MLRLKDLHNRVLKAKWFFMENVIYFSSGDKKIGKQESKYALKAVDCNLKDLLAQKA